MTAVLTVIDPAIIIERSEVLQHSIQRHRRLSWLNNDRLSFFLKGYHTMEFAALAFERHWKGKRDIAVNTIVFVGRRCVFPNGLIF